MELLSINHSTSMAFISMSQKDLHTYEVVKRSLRREITVVQAGELLQRCERQIYRLKARAKTQGVQGLMHRNRGKRSNRRMPEEERRKIEKLLQERYPDFGPTFASEKLREQHRIQRDPKTIRALMTGMGLWQGRKRKNKAVHHWRARREHPGELVQFDGSYEFWFEDRGEKTCLLAAIDDATGKVLQAQFVAHEGVFPVLGFWQGYVGRHGKPRAIYLDKFSTYKQNRPKGEEDFELKTQFQRALWELGIEPIFANSPQAKGRVERLFKTLQDRLIKELRLQNISTPEVANHFLQETFLPDFNRRFAVTPVSVVDLHRTLRAEERKNLDAVFSRKEERIIRNDYTVSFKNAWYQLLSTPRIVVRPKDRIMLEERLDSSLYMRIRQSYLRFKKLPNRPQRAVEAPWVLAELPEQPATRVPWKPSADHPWRAMNAAKHLVPVENGLVQCALRGDTRSA